MIKKMKEEMRVKIDGKKQSELFIRFIKEFKKDFSKASNYLRISNSNLSKYKRGVTRYIPESVLIRIINHLNIEKSKILEKGTLTKIRRNYIYKAYPILKKKYGKNWAKELTRRRDFKGISLKDFPDNIFIYLEERYRKRLLERAYNLAGSLEKLARIINISPSRLSSWYKGKQRDYKRNKIGLQFLPISKLKLISKLLVEDNNHEFVMENIERNTIMYRMQAGNPIKNPNFPIKESPEMIRLLFHLLGDGYGGKKGECANYKNTCPELLEEFKNDLRIFGNVPLYKQKDSIKFPRVIATIIKEFYSIDLRTFESKITKKIIKIPKKWICQGIRAFADDEGTIYTNSVRLTSGNYDLLAGIGRLLDYLKLKHNNVKSQSNEKARRGVTYYLDIKGIERYNKLIGSTHPKKKEKIERYVRKKKAKRRKRLLKLKL